MDLGLDGKSAVITGASRGIGFAVAERFAAEGCNVALVARNRVELEDARSRLERGFPSARVETFSADLAAEPSARLIAESFPDADILVNNAGAIRVGTLETVDDALWRSYWDLKVFGYINLTRACYENMKSRRRGVVVNVIGAAGERLNANYIAGSSGNAALIAFTRALGAVSPQAGVRVLGVNPGPVLTEKLQMTLEGRALERLGDRQRWRELTTGMPFGRPAEPEEIAATVVFLASDLSSYTTGTVVTVDGGRTNLPIME